MCVLKAQLLCVSAGRSGEGPAYGREILNRESPCRIFPILSLGDVGNKCYFFIWISRYMDIHVIHARARIVCFYIIEKNWLSLTGLLLVTYRLDGVE